MNDLDRINRAFAELEKKGYETSCNEDCSNCATSILNTNKYVYYHTQDVERLVDGNIPRREIFYIGWGEDGDLDEICAALEYEGFGIIKPKNTSKRIGLR
jgi:hypothetical protein